MSSISPWATPASPAPRRSTTPPSASFGSSRRSSTVTPAPRGTQEARQRFANSLNRRFGTCYTADQFYITVGAAASLCCVFNGLTCPGDEFVVFAPYFPEYKVFIEGAGAKMVLIPPEIEALPDRL